MKFATKFFGPRTALAAVAFGVMAVKPVPAADTASGQTVQLPPYEVIEAKDPKRDLPNPLFDHVFADLRSGPMIEAILWRHHYLKDHPQEEAVIVTTHNGGVIVSATTVYTKEGKVLGSSNAVGESLAMRGMVPADLHRPQGIARAQKIIVGVRGTLRDALQGANGVDVTDSNEAINLMTVTAESAAAVELALNGGSFLDMKGPAMTAGRRATTDQYRDLNNAYVAAAHAAGDSGSPVLGAIMVNAEETGDYRVLGATAGAPAPVDVANLRKAHVPEVAISQMIVQRLESNLQLRRTFVLPFTAPSDEVLENTYRALRNSERAGIVPVALASFGGKDAAVPIPPFVKKAAKPTAHEQTCLVLDWEGIQYYYQPDIGTWAQPLPTNSLTGQPFLCVKHGALMECAYFCATYLRQHPDGKVQVVPGEPVLAAFQKDDKLGIFIPSLGVFSLPKEYLEALGDFDYLGQIRDKLVAMPPPAGTTVNKIPEGMVGDDGDMQMRRAFVAFKAAGIRCALDESGQPTFTFTWDHVDYVYGPDQQVRVVEQ